MLTVTQMLRKKGVVDKFVEFYGAGIAALSLPDRATIANMAPEYGATMGFFPVDAETLAYLRFTGRTDDHVQLVERYARRTCCGTTRRAKLRFSDTLSLDLGTVEPSLAGPARPQDRVPLKTSRRAWRQARRPRSSATSARLRCRPRSTRWTNEGGHPAPGDLGDEPRGHDRHTGTFALGHGSVVIAAITSCTNTSNPSVLIAAGLLAKKAVAKGLTSQAVGQDLARAGLAGRHRLPDARPA